MDDLTPQFENKLLYHGFSVILMQTFVPNTIKTIPYDSLSDFVDSQVFVKFNDEFVTRYELPDFHAKIVLSPEGDDPNTIEGRVMVQAAVYFNCAVSLTYRFVVDGEDKFCRTEKPFTTDHLILLSGIVQGVEHWEKKKNGEYCISNDSYDVHISGLKISNYESSFSGSQGAFEKVQDIYKSIFVDMQNEDACCEDYNYTHIDVWENVANSGEVSFDDLSEAETIAHIEKYHRSELVGLMSLYPFEWPYRTASEYKSICGSDIAIDTDDLVLTNENVTLVIGTYGLRGEGALTVWDEHLETRQLYHTSWIEYFILVEVTVVKKSVINYVLSKYIQNLNVVDNKRDMNVRFGADVKDVIEENAFLNIHLMSVIAKFDIVRYLRFMSHKHMLRRCSQNLFVAEDMAQLNNIVNNSDLALNNANNVRELKQSGQTNMVLGIISAASLFQIVLTEAKIPLFDSLGLSCFARVSGRLIVFATIILFFYALVSYILSFINSKK